MNMRASTLYRRYNSAFLLTVILGYAESVGPFGKQHFEFEKIFEKANPEMSLSVNYLPSFDPQALALDVLDLNDVFE